MKLKFFMSILSVIGLFMSQVNPLTAQEIQTNFAVSIGGTSNDYGSGISPDGMGNSYVTGHYFGNITLGDSVYTTMGNQDAYIAKLDAEGEVLWALAFGGGGADEGKAVATDADGNCYATGFIGSVGIVIQGQPITSLGGYDVYVMKFSPEGSLLWARTFGSGTNDKGAAISVDAEGYVHVAGSFAATMIVDESILVSTASFDAFSCKMDALGNVLWARSISGPNLVEARGIAIDLSGNTYVSGDFLGGEVSAGPFTEGGPGSYDIFLVKYDPDGEVLDLQAFGTEGADSGMALTTDLGGNLFMGGYFEGNFQIGNLSVSSNGNRDMMVVKFDESGTALWAQTVGASGNDITNALATDIEGNCYFTGVFYQTVTLDDFTLTGGGTLLAKLNPQGTYAWAINFADGGVDNGGRGITVSEDGGVTVIGNFFSPFSIGGTELVSSGGRQVYVVRIEDVLYLNTQQFESGRVLHVFPNPASSYAHIEGLAPYTRCELLNMRGQLVYQTRTTPDRITIDLSTLPVGMYLLRAEINGELMVAKIQVTR